MKDVLKSTALAFVLATVAVQPLAAEMVTELGAGEGQLNIVAWPGYIERGETVEAFDWVTGFEQADIGAHFQNFTGNFEPWRKGQRRSKLVLIFDQQDVRKWIRALKNTWMGDTNIDGEFNSGDLVALFTAGEYEDGIPMNSNWSTGDFDGDGDFGSGDLIAAFADGGFELGPRAAVSAVPEPTSMVILMMGMLSIARCSRRAHQS